MADLKAHSDHVDSGSEKHIDAEHHHASQIQHLTDSAKIGRPLILASTISYAAAFNYGFSAALIAATLQSPGFFAAYPEVLANTQLIGCLVAMTNVGGTFGIPWNAWVADKFGRKAGFLNAVLFTLLGTGLSAGSTSYGMIVAGRFIQLFGGWGGVCSAISYVQEISPTFARGDFGAGIGPSINSGYFAASWVQAGFFYWGNNALNWRIPQIFAIIPPLFMLAMLFVIPESPRWLVWNNKPEKALDVFKKLHKDLKKDPEYVLAREEHFQVVKQVALDKTLVQSWFSMFTKYRNRTLAAMLITFVNQMSGPQVVTNYGPGIYVSAGLTPANSLFVAGGWYICCVVFAAFWARFVDKIGRKMLICGGVLGTLLSFCIITALYAVYVDRTAPGGNVVAGQRALIFSFFLYIFWYQMSEPAMFLFIGEIFGSHVRNKGIALGLMSITITSSWLTMAFPVGVAAGQWKFFLLLIGCMAVGLVLQVIMLKETKGVPLEEMAALWGDSEDVAIYSNQIDINVVEAEEKRHGA